MAAPAASVVIETDDGRVLTRAALPALAAPSDLKPRTATVTLSLPARPEGRLWVRVVTPEGVSQITQRNNRVSLP